MLTNGACCNCSYLTIDGLLLSSRSSLEHGFLGGEEKLQTLVAGGVCDMQREGGRKKRDEEREREKERGKEREGERGRGENREDERKNKPPATCARKRAWEQRGRRLSLREKGGERQEENEEQRKEKRERGRELPLLWVARCLQEHRAASRPAPLRYPRCRSRGAESSSL